MASKGHRIISAVGAGSQELTSVCSCVLPCEQRVPSCVYGSDDMAFVVSTRRLNVCFHLPVGLLISLNYAHKKQTNLVYE